MILKVRWRQVFDVSRPIYLFGGKVYYFNSQFHQKYQKNNMIYESHPSKEKPEEELRFISMTDDLEARFSPQKKNQNRWDIQPWQDEQYNPSLSPQRRNYAPRQTVTPNSSKTGKNLISLKATIKPQSKNILEPNNNCNFSIRVRNQQRPSKLGLQKIQSQNSRPSTMRCLSKARRQSLREQDVRDVRKDTETSEFYQAFREPVNMIVYPMLNQGKKKRLFRKMQKFTNFVSVSLRK